MQFLTHERWEKTPSRSYILLSRLFRAEAGDECQTASLVDFWHRDHNLGLQRAAAERCSRVERLTVSTGDASLVPPQLLFRVITDQEL